MHSRGLRFTWFLRWALLAALWFPIDARAQDNEPKIPEPEAVLLKTKDGLQLHATFYPARDIKGEDGQSVPKKLRVPVILLHGYKGEGHDLEELALMLQAKGHAVMVPDLRGHGESVQFNSGDGGNGDKIEAESLKGEDVEAMFQIGGDLETIKSFLVDKNNKGELNIDKLCLVGVDMGAIVALKWALLDWAGFQTLSTGKQGQDVKALVLISPESNFKGVRTADVINSPPIRSELAMLLIAGRKGSRPADEVNKLYRTFNKYHQEKSAPPLERMLPETKLQGAALLGEKSLGVEEAIVKFVNQLGKRPYPWAERKSPFE